MNAKAAAQHVIDGLPEHKSSFFRNYRAPVGLRLFYVSLRRKVYAWPNTKPCDDCTLGKQTSQAIEASQDASHTIYHLRNFYFV
jgi:hypothetical protein